MLHQQDVGQDDAGDQSHLPPYPDSMGLLPPTSSEPIYSPSPNSGVRDLSNMKLAQNQTELSKQIADLSRVVEEQGLLLRRLVNVLEGDNMNSRKGKEREGDLTVYTSGYQY